MTPEEKATKKMRKVSQAAKKVLDTLANRATANDGHIKIDNAPGAFMPVSVEWRSEDQLSVAHYFEQCGDLVQDLVQDPDVVYLHSNDAWYPVSIQHSFGRTQTAVNFDEHSEDAKVKSFYPRLQKEISVFTTSWMKNIKFQQGL